MKLVVCADLHVHARKLESNDGGQDRLADGLSALRQTLQFARQYDCPWVFLGDVKEPRRSWPVDALTGVLSVVREFADVEKIVVKGNHDGEGAYGSGLDVLAPYAPVVNVPTVRGSWAFWPAASRATWTPAEFVESLPTCVDVLLGHGFFRGATLGPDDFRGEGDLTLEEFGLAGRTPRFKVALFGDVHKGQVLARGRGRGRAEQWVPFRTTEHLAERGAQSIRAAQPWRGEVLYAGSPYQQNWGEREDGPKGALLVDLDSGDVELLRVTAPRYVLETWPECPRVDNEYVQAYWSGNFVRVVAGAWARSADTLFHHFVAASQPRSFSLEIIEPREVEQRAEVHAAMGPREMCEAYAAARPLDGVAPEHVVDAGVALTQED